MTRNTMAPAAPTEPTWWAAALNRRATVEQWMFDAARGKRPMPTPEELRSWATKLGTPAAGEPLDAEQSFNANGIAWAVSCWQAEVMNRPLVNVHRRTLDDTWRQVIRYFGGDPDKLLGPDHDTLHMQAQEERAWKPPAHGVKGPDHG